MTAKIIVRLFADAREKLGVDFILADVPAPPTIAKLRVSLSEQSPALAKLLPHAMFAVEQRYVGNDTSLRDGEEVAMIPPVSGG